MSNWKALSVLALALLVSACEDPNQEANKLLVQAAMLTTASAPSASVDERLSKINAAIGLLQTIQKKYPQSDVATKIATGQPIGDLDLRKLQESASALENEKQDRACRLNFNAKCALALAAPVLKTPEDKLDGLAGLSQAFLEENNLPESQNSIDLYALILASLNNDDYAERLYYLRFSHRAHSEDFSTLINETLQLQGDDRISALNAIAQYLITKEDQKSAVIVYEHLTNYSARAHVQLTNASLIAYGPDAALKHAAKISDAFDRDRAYGKIGAELMRLNRTSEARALVSKLSKPSARYFYDYEVVRGIARRSKNDAVNYVERELDQYTKGNGYINIIRGLDEAGKAEEARDIPDKVERLYKDRALSALADAFTSAKRFDEASSTINKIIDDKIIAAPSYRLAIAQIEQGDRHSAIRQLDRISRAILSTVSAAERGEALAMSGDLQFRLGRPGDAEKSMRAALESAGSATEFYVRDSIADRVAKGFARAGRLDEAVSAGKRYSETTYYTPFIIKEWAVNVMKSAHPV